jgi:acyl carrier protein
MDGMGLDGVELVLEIEEAFGIKISDDEAAGVLTVGDLYKLVERETGRLPPLGAPCLSASTFRLARMVATKLMGNEQARIRPNDRLNLLFQGKARRVRWSKYQNALSLKLPSLVRPPVLETALAAVGFAAGALIGGVVLMSPVGWAAFPAGALGGCAVYAAAYFLTTPFAICLPRKCVTFRDLTNALLISNYDVLKTRFQPSGTPTAWNESLWLEVASIVVRQLGASPELVTPDASFALDLGMD